MEYSNSRTQIRLGEPGKLRVSPFLIVLAIFFLSGFSGLVYQVVWVKLLTHFFGVTTTRTVADQWWRAVAPEWR